MNINQLKYFVAVASYRSFTKAANQYYISQTAITQQIRALEDIMGVQLFDRNSRPIALTPAGSVFYSEAKAILERVENAIARARDASAGLVGTLRVGYTKGYEKSDLSSKLRSFHIEYPNVLITCYRCDTDMLASGLLNGEYDVIFTWDSTNIRQESQVELKVIEQAPLMVVLYGGHHLAHRKSLTRAELKDETIIYMSPSGTGDSFGDEHFMQLYRREGYNPNILIRSNDVESILIMVAAEEGISVLPDYMTRKLSNEDGLVFIPLVGEEESEEILAVWRSGDQSLPLRHFVERL